MHIVGGGLGRGVFPGKTGHKPRRAKKQREECTAGPFNRARCSQVGPQSAPVVLFKTSAVRVNILHVAYGLRSYHVGFFL